MTSRCASEPPIWCRRRNAGKEDGPAKCGLRLWVCRKASLTCPESLTPPDCRCTRLLQASITHKGGSAQAVALTLSGKKWEVVHDLQKKASSGLQ